MGERSRFRRVLTAVASGIGLLIVFLIATVAALVTHLDRPGTRRLVIAQVNQILATTLAGDVRIERIGSLGLGGIDGVSATIRDPEHVQVLAVDGVRVRIRALDAAKSALFGKGPIRIDVPSASVGNVDANLDADAEGNLRIANAFASKTPSPSNPNEPPGRGVYVDVPVVRLRHAWVHGVPAGAPLVDADLSELAARARVDGSNVLAEIDRLGVVTRALPRGADPKGNIHGKFTMPAENGQGIDVTAFFDGETFGATTTLEARMTDRRIDARLDVHDTTGVRAGAAVTELTIHEPLSIHAEAHGDLPQVIGEVQVVLGKATVDAHAVVEASKTTRIQARVKARDVDVALVVEGAPTTQLGLDATADVAIDPLGGIRGEAVVDTMPGLVDHQAIPRAEIRGTVDGESAQVRARIQDASMPTEVSVDVAPRRAIPDGRTVTAALRSRIPDLHRIPIVGTKVGGSAEIDATARLSLPEQSIADARVRVAVKKATADKLSLKEVEVKAKASGTVEHLFVDTELHAGQLLTGALPIASVDGKAHLERAGNVFTVRDAKVDAVRPASPKVSASVRLVRIAGQNLQVEGVEVLGVGDPLYAEMSKDAREIRARIDAPKIDVPLAARLAGKSDELQITKGTFGIQGEGAFRGGVAKGKVHAEVRDLTMRSIEHGAVTLDGTIDDRVLDLDMIAHVGDAVGLSVHTDHVVLGGHVDDPRSWSRIAGKVHVTGDIDMSRLATLVPPEKLPVADLRGALTVQGRVGRDTADAPPEIQLHTHTVGLGFATRSGVPEKKNGITMEEPSPLKSTDFDIGADIRNDGQSGFTGVSFRATDKRGVVVSFDAKAILPYAELMRDPAHAFATLSDVPINVKVVVPPRRFDQLPTIIAPAGMRGAMEAVVDASGTILEPRVHVGMRTRGAHSSAMPADTDADADVTFDYDGQNAELAAKVSSGGKQLADVGAHAVVRSRDVLARVQAGQTLDGLDWHGSAGVRLVAFPLESVPQLADSHVRGSVSGEVALEGLHQDARVAGHFDFAKLAVGTAEYKSGRASIDTSGGKVVAQVRLDQTDGDLDAQVSSGLSWGASLVPSLDDKQPIKARLVAHNFRAAAIQPFIENAVPSFDGRIDADASAGLVPGKPGAELSGNVVFRDGTVLVAALGEELRGVKAKVALSPDGTIRVTDVVAKGTQGQLNADATVKLDGTRLESAVANIRIPEKTPISLAVQGSPIGELHGSIAIKASQSVDAKKTSIVVEVPKLGVELPQVTKTGVQALDAKSNVHVGVFRSSDRFMELPFDANDIAALREEMAADRSSLEVDVRLGQITIHRGNQVEVHLTGNPKITIAGGETKIVGQIRVNRGSVDVQGKKFEVEKGTVTFNGESPPDPVVVATAGWTAADNSRIYADFIGPVSTGKVTLRSEPPRPKNEILAMVLFGTADGANPPAKQQGGDKDSTMKTAAGLSGGYIAQGLTEALDDLGGIQATARIDTTSSNNPRPEVEFQLSPKVSFGVAHVIGQPPITEPDTNLANIEYRFKRNWSLESIFGDKGTTKFDAIWQKRY